MEIFRTQEMKIFVLFTIFLTCTMIAEAEVTHEQQIEESLSSDGVSLDGGGSTTMVVNGVIMNNPSDEPPCYGTASAEVQPDGPVDQRQALLEIENIDSEITATQGCERYVANSMMMVVVEPMERSTRFTPGDQIRTEFPTNLRLGPGDNYAVFTIIPAGVEGVVIEHSNDLNGVLAKGDYWWKVDFGGAVGWMSEHPSPPEPSPTPSPTITPEPSVTPEPGPQSQLFLSLIQR